MNLDALFSHKAFASLEPEQMRLFRQFALDIQGKGATEIGRMYMQLSQKANQIKPIPPSTRNAIIDAVMQHLPPGDRQKVSGFMRMLR